MTQIERATSDFGFGNGWRFSVEREAYEAIPSLSKDKTPMLSEISLVARLPVATRHVRPTARF